MNLLFRLSKETDGFENITKTRDFFKYKLQEFFYNHNQFQQLNKNDLIYFIYDNFIIAKANYDDKIKINENNYFKIGLKLSNIEILYINEKISTNIIGTRTTYLDSNEKIEELDRVLSHKYKMENISSILNQLSNNYKIGKLQQLRKKFLNLKRHYSKEIFSNKTIYDDYAFHSGGRTELQFNIGFEKHNNIDILRYGVAFSLGKTRTLLNIEDLLPKIRLFNEYILENKDHLSDLRMWYYFNGSRSINSTPKPIENEIFKEKAFIFLGTFSPLNKLDYDEILLIMDRLLPLYIYTMNNGELLEKINPFEFKKGNTTKKISTKMNRTKQELDMNLRHNQIQEYLYNDLCKKYGENNVGTEVPIENGFIDLVVKKAENEFWFYEIKTYRSVRLCIREAIGQLLEYSYWNTNKQVTKLFIVGEAELDKENESFIKTLNKNFKFNLEYLTYSIKED